MRYPLLASLAATLCFSACSSNPPSGDSVSANDISHLKDVLATQPEEVQARYQWRHPVETLSFFGIKPGMTVVEALPGGGWYTKILLPYLGTEGELMGADYATDMWPKFGFLDAAALEKKKTWTTDWVAEVNDWGIDNSASVSAFVLGSLPKSAAGSADAVLFIRALHNLARFEDDGGFLTAAIADAYTVLKPGGIVGVVQHEARPDMPDDWATGNNGYLKKSFVIAQFEAAGFELVSNSSVNANPKDQPATSDSVWRLPPTMYTVRDKPELQEKMKAIGESNRMTLKFRKPQ